MLLVEPSTAAGSWLGRGRPVGVAGSRQQRSREPAQHDDTCASDDAQRALHGHAAHLNQWRSDWAAEHLLIGCPACFSRLHVVVCCKKLCDNPRSVGVEIRHCCVALMISRKAAVAMQVPGARWSPLRVSPPPSTGSGQIEKKTGAPLVSLDAARAPGAPPQGTRHPRPGARRPPPGHLAPAVGRRRGRPPPPQNQRECELHDSPRLRI